MGFPTGTLFYNIENIPMYEKTTLGFKELFGRKDRIESGPFASKWDNESSWEGWRIEYPKEQLFDKLYLRLKG